MVFWAEQIVLLYLSSSWGNVIDILIDNVLDILINWLFQCGDLSALLLNDFKVCLLLAILEIFSDFFILFFYLMK